MNNYVSVTEWAGEWFLWNHRDADRMEYLRINGFPHIVIIETKMNREDFDSLVGPATTGLWTKTVEILGASHFRVLAAFQNAPDAIMARMLVER